MSSTHTYKQIKCYTNSFGTDGQTDRQTQTDIYVLLTTIKVITENVILKIYVIATPKINLSGIACLRLKRKQR